MVSRRGISYPALVAARMALARENLEFCYALKSSAGFPMFNIREIQMFITQLDGLETRSLRPWDLKQTVMAQFLETNTWTAQIEQILDGWCHINRDIAISTAVAKQFALETLLEERQEKRTGTGVFLGTVHSVKGMEFPHVFLLDDGWHQGNLEEERRLFYVGMTRAESPQSDLLGTPCGGDSSPCGLSTESFRKVTDKTLEALAPQCRELEERLKQLRDTLAGFKT